MKVLPTFYGQLYSPDEIGRYGRYKTSLNPFSKNDTNEANNRFFDAVRLHEKIKLIHERYADKNQQENIIKTLEAAKEIIIIGFGFDRDNLTYLGFPNKLAHYKNHFSSQKIIKYMDFKGQMDALYEQFSQFRNFFSYD